MLFRLATVMSRLARLFSYRRGCVIAWGVIRAWEGDITVLVYVSRAWGWSTVRHTSSASCIRLINIHLMAY